MRRESFLEEFHRTVPDYMSTSIHSLAEHMKVWKLTVEKAVHAFSATGVTCRRYGST